MSKLISILVVLLLLPAAVARAAEAHRHSGQADSSAQATDQSMQEMQQHMLKLHEQMHKTTDAKGTRGGRRPADDSRRPD